MAIMIRSFLRNRTDRIVTILHITIIGFLLVTGQNWRKGMGGGSANYLFRNSQSERERERGGKARSE